MHALSHNIINGIATSITYSVFDVKLGTMLNELFHNFRMTFFTCIKECSPASLCERLQKNNIEYNINTKYVYK